ncbi:hypothetical protein MPER_08273, partial [Moniliophthora perniciosa FA553]
MAPIISYLETVCIYQLYLANEMEPKQMININGGVFHNVALAPGGETQGACPCEKPHDRPSFETYTSVTEDLPYSYQKAGVSIGDVVALDDQGGYDYFFNILLPKDDERNLGRVPEGFIPLIDLEPNIMRNPSQHLPGSFIASPTGEISRDPLYLGSYLYHHA